MLGYRAGVVQANKDEELSNAELQTKQMSTGLLNADWY
jgi:hypothetical protein